MARPPPGSVTGATNTQVMCHWACSVPQDTFWSWFSPDDTRFCLHQLCIKAKPASLKAAIFNADRKKGFRTVLFILQNQTVEWQWGSNHDITWSGEQLPPKYHPVICVWEQGWGIAIQTKTGYDTGWVIVLPDQKVTGCYRREGGDTSTWRWRNLWAKLVWLFRHVSRVNKTESVMIPPSLSAESLICVFAWTLCLKSQSE